MSRFTLNELILQYFKRLASVLSDPAAAAGQTVAVIWKCTAWNMCVISLKLMVLIAKLWRLFVKIKLTGRFLLS